ncbi:DUF6527 family protein [Cryobacterium sp. 10S3]|uniref:DUF6527 family protein n=1 Tax=unclassified Cryobacterium TaxID=2649013 RepID=UPI0034DD4B84
MTGVEHLKSAFVESFPPRLDPGVLYICLRFNTCGHLCCCGCGEEVITPLSPARWSFTYDGENVSMSPSIGSWALPCRSHYLITQGDIIWSRRFSPHQIEAARSGDRHALRNEDQQVPSVGPTRCRPWWRWLVRR